MPARTPPKTERVIKQTYDPELSDPGRKMDRTSRPTPEVQAATIDTAHQFLHELGKSFGFRRDEQGDWSWSPSNVVTSFKEDPFWTTLDLGTFAIAPLKLGTAAAAFNNTQKGLKAGKVKAIAKATSVEKAFAEGRLTEIAGEAAMTPRIRKFSLTDRVGQKVLGKEKMAAIQMAQDTGGFSRTPLPHKMKGFFRSPTSTRFTSTNEDLYKAGFQSNDLEQRFYGKWLEREAKLDTWAMNRRITDQQVNWGKVEKGWAKKGETRLKQAKFTELMESGLDINDPALMSQAVEEFGEEGAKYFRQTYELRGAIHQKAFDMGLISEETYQRHLNKYWPRFYKEWEEIYGAGISMAETGVSSKRARHLAARTMPAEQADELWQRIMSPAAGLDELFDATQLIGEQKYIRALSGSVSSRTGEDLLRLVDDIAAGDESLAALHGVSMDQIARVKALENIRHGMGMEIAAEEAAEKLGWLSLDKLIKKAGVEGLADRVPKELLGRYIDPIIANDMIQTMKWNAEKGNLQKFYNTGLAYFRASKTAYNPATMVRNLFGAAVFHNIAVGGRPFKLPRAGWKMLREGEGNKYYDMMRDMGGLSEQFHVEIREAIETGLDLDKTIPRGQASALDWMQNLAKKMDPESIVGKGAQGVANKATQVGSKMERLYRGIDEVYRADAFATLMDRAVKSGKFADDAEAAKWAMNEVIKYTPSFSQHSQFTDMVRSAVPFASFTTESLRVWKNTLETKPHLAYFWFNAADAASTIGAGAVGASPTEMENAQAALPEYLNNKKLLALPFRVNDKVQFLDMSYLIPLANMVDGVQQGELFFDEIVNPIASNPFLSIGVGAFAEVDPYSGRPIAPQATRNLVTTPNESARRVVGIGEHIVRSFAPPLAPGGYAFQNLWEMGTGQKSGVTGEELEANRAKTIAANVFGMRVYNPTVESLIKNTRQDTREKRKKISDAWRRWESAAANGDLAAMEAEEVRIVGLKTAEGEDGEAYFSKNKKRHVPGKGKLKSGLSKKDINKILEQAETFNIDEVDERLLSGLKAKQ